MAWTQRVIECPDEHPDCEVIECVDGKGTVAWQSHAHNSTHADCRANPAIKLEGGNSKKPLCEECVATLTAGLPSA